MFASAIYGVFKIVMTPQSYNLGDIMVIYAYSITAEQLSKVMRFTFNSQRYN